MISRLQLASEKQGKSLLTYQLLVGREKGRVLVPMGEPLRRLCVETLKCNMQRAGLLDHLAFPGDGYNSIPITLLRTALHHSSFSGASFFFNQCGIRILLICVMTSIIP